MSDFGSSFHFWINSTLVLVPVSGFGSISTTESAVTVAAMNNGWPGALRRLKLPILVARTDTVEGTYGVAGGASLSFTNSGQSPCLVWFNVFAGVKGDAR